MEWEVSLIEWIQKALGSLHSTVGTILSFLGGEIGLMLVLLIVLFCWKKESGKRLALIIAAVNTWLPMLKAAVTPRVLPPEITLSKTNARLAVFGLAAKILDGVIDNDFEAADRLMRQKAADMGLVPAAQAAQAPAAEGAL